MTVSARVLNRSTLDRQLLLERASVEPLEAVRRVVAVQAQQPGSPYIALWNRVAGLDPRRLDVAADGFRVVRSTLMRITLHLVHAEDYRPFREAVEPTLRGSRLRDRRFTDCGITPADADALLPDLLAYAAEVRSAEELRARAERAWGGGTLTPVAWRLLRQYAPLWHVPSGPPWAFGASPALLAAGPEPVAADPEVAAAGLRALVRRYLAGFGPASVADAAQFALVQRGRVRQALAELGDEVEEVRGPDGTVLYDLAGAVRPDGGIPAPPRLMAMWDSVFLAYADRSRLIPPAYRKHVIRINGDVLPAVLVDGYVAGVWRPVDGAGGQAGGGGAAGHPGGIEVSAFEPLPPAVWEGLAAEAAGLGAFLAERDARVYGRYGHWWAKGLPVVERRVLPAA